MMASPINLSSMPSSAWMQSTINVKYSFKSDTVPWGPNFSVRVVKLRTSENNTVHTDSVPPITSSPAASICSAMPGSMYRDIVDFMRFSELMSSIISRAPNFFSWSVSLTRGRMVMLAEPNSAGSSSSPPATSRSASMNSSCSWLSLTPSIFSRIHSLAPAKNSFADAPMMASSVTFKILRPAELHVTMTPSSSAQHGSGEIAGLVVEWRIKAQVGIGMGNGHRLPGCEHSASDAQMVGQADFTQRIPLGHPGK